MQFAGLLNLHDIQIKHRDLHWGQILVKETDADSSSSRKNAVMMGSLMMNDPNHGVRATIIDLGLARIDRRESGRDNTYWTPFDAAIFEGEGLLWTSISYLPHLDI